MAITSNCCLNLPPPSSKSNSDLYSGNTKINQGTIPARHEMLRKQCMAGIACVVIGLEFQNFTPTITNENIAMAKDAQLVAMAKESMQKQKGARTNIKWSEKRMCPPWHWNSLETIVPENLPRPSFRRRWEAIGFDGTNIINNGPSIEGVNTNNSSCFSL